MRLARALRLVVALALFLVWQDALLHPLEHLDHTGEFVHVAGTTLDPDEKGGPSALCDVIAAVATCVGDAAKPIALAFPGSDAIRLTRGSAPRVAESRPFQGQAPPSLS